jgi:Transglycosylase
MKQFALVALRGTVAVVAFAGGAVALLFLFYEVHDFRPYLPRIEAIYASMDPEDRQPPDNVRTFVWKVDGDMVDGFTSSELLAELRERPMRMSAWHYHSFMLGWMIRWHFSKLQRLALYCHYLLYEGGRGFTSAANFYFRKRPDTLSADELATIVAVGRAPRMNSPTRHPERLEVTKKRLLSAYEKNQ